MNNIIFKRIWQDEGFYEIEVQTQNKVISKQRLSMLWMKYSKSVEETDRFSFWQQQRNNVGTSLH